MTGMPDSKWSSSPAVRSPGVMTAMPGPKYDPRRCRHPVVARCQGDRSGRRCHPVAPRRSGVRRRGTRCPDRDVRRRAIRATVDLFAQLDDRYGGGHARQALVQYLSTDGERLLRGRYADPAGRALVSAVAEATLLAAWMAYDSAPTAGLAQRYFVQALALAQAGDDRLLGASIPDAMSHQATYIGRFAEAANLARAAHTGTRGLATPTLTAHLHTMEARALARLGDARACDAALAAAIREFDQRNPGDDPAWFQYFNEAELAAEFGHCFRDLGRARTLPSMPVSRWPPSGRPHSSAATSSPPSSWPTRTWPAANLSRHAPWRSRP
jgi:hypothetical protein